MTICNLSDYGLMARCSDPPPRGAFIELRKGAVTIVGQVRWSRDQRIGVRTQDRIDMVSVLEDGSKTPPSIGNERRAKVREAVALAAGPTPEELAERSRRRSRLLDWLVIAGVGVVSAGVLAEQVHALLSAPMQQAKAALEP